MNAAELIDGSQNYDLRYIRTEYAIESAVGEMLKSGQIAGIKVREICTKSGASPATFYRHFKNPDDVLTRKSLQLEAEFESEKLSRYQNDSDFSATITGTLLFFSKHKEFFEVPIQGNWLRPIRNIVKLLKPIFHGYWLKYGSSAADRLFWIFCTEMIGVIYWWGVKEEFDPNTIARHAKYLLRLAETMSDRIEYLGLS